MAELMLTQKQIKALELLWFKYGNGGSMSTNDNHKFMQRHIEGRHKDALLFAHRITPACKDAFQRILDNDYSELQPNQVKLLGHGWETEEEKQDEVRKG